MLSHAVRTSKYNNKRVQAEGGRSFMSNLESAVGTMMQSRLNAGEFAEIQQQDHVYLTDAEICYIADFKCTKKDGSVVWVEAKGFEGERWKIIMKLWKYYGPGPLEIWKGDANRPYLKETIWPVAGRRTMARQQG